jgi:hypothetical protein
MKWSLGLLVAIVVALLFLFGRREDGFFGATSPGTMVQLQTSHVPTEEDEYYWKYVYPKQVQREIYDMTESDLH